MAAEVPTANAINSVKQLEDFLKGTNKVKVAGCVIMYVHHPILTDLVTQVSTVGLDYLF
jgi:hypothetical protein